MGAKTLCIPLEQVRRCCCCVCVYIGARVHSLLVWGGACPSALPLPPSPSLPMQPDLPAGTPCFVTGQPAKVWALWGRSY